MKSVVTTAVIFIMISQVAYVRLQPLTGSDRSPRQEEEPAIAPGGSAVAAQILNGILTEEVGVGDVIVGTFAGTAAVLSDPYLGRNVTGILTAVAPGVSKFFTELSHRLLPEENKPSSTTKKPRRRQTTTYKPDIPASALFEQKPGHGPLFSQYLKALALASLSSTTPPSSSTPVEVSSEKARQEGIDSETKATIESTTKSKEVYEYYEYYESLEEYETPTTRKTRPKTTTTTTPKLATPKTTTTTTTTPATTTIPVTLPYSEPEITSKPITSTETTIIANNLSIKLSSCNSPEEPGKTFLCITLLVVTLFTGIL